MLGPETDNEYCDRCAEKREFILQSEKLRSFENDLAREKISKLESKLRSATNGNIFFVFLFLTQLFIVLFMWPAKAHAIQPDQKCKRAILTWEPPATRVNGQPLTIEELDYYEVEVRDDATNEVEAYIFNNFPAKIEDHGAVREYFYSSKQDQVRPLRAGNQCFKIRVVDTEGLKSVWSEEACKQICLWNMGIDLRARIGVTDE